MLYLKTLIIVVQLLSALGIIGLVLLQHGKGADMGAAFGSGASGSLFGATGSANFLSRSTAVLAAIFFVTTLTLTYLGAYHAKPSAGVLGTAATTSAPAETPASGPASAAASASVSAATNAVASGASAAAPASPAPGQDVPK